MKRENKQIKSTQNPRAYIIYLIYRILKIYIYIYTYIWHAYTHVRNVINLLLIYWNSLSFSSVEYMAYCN